MLLLLPLLLPAVSVQPARQGERYMRPSEPQTGSRRWGSHQQEGVQGAEKVGAGQCSRNMNTCEVRVTQRGAGTAHQGDVGELQRAAGGQQLVPRQPQPPHQPPAQQRGRRTRRHHQHPHQLRRAPCRREVKQQKYLLATKISIYLSVEM